MDSSQPPVITSQKARRFALLGKIAGMCVLILLLHVPLAMTDGVLRERKQYREEAVSQIATVWGGRQTVTGPILAVPYTYRGHVTRTKIVNGNAVQVDEAANITGTAFFLPEELDVRGSITPEVRYRGIHEAVVYGATLNLKGHFVPDFAAAGITAESIHWEDARVMFGVSDPKGVRSVSAIRVDDAEAAGFENAGGAPRETPNPSANVAQDAPDLRRGFKFDTAPQSREGLSLAAKVAGAANGKRLGFEFETSLQGCGRFEVAPIGKATAVRLTSPWANPSFVGASLPASREINAGGFDAEWHSTHFSRAFSQSWTSKQTALTEAMTAITASASGVDFAQPVDGYRLAERAQKYGVLFFVLVFAVFFLFEVSAPLRIHPLQYAMVGAALCLFFLGFLALSEFLPTGAAYALAAGACTALVSFYSLSVLKSGRRTSVIAGGLAATYGYLYFVLKSQDYALLAGTAALFIALAIVMFFTRRIDWYSLEMKPVADGAK
ncbi:MAG TPA: cell envelope integrity protein CreD [Opitutaceae bacterium]|nr:cell envelope integrity protein CreD [Opitutaceae bacterium]